MSSLAGPVPAGSTGVPASSSMSAIASRQQRYRMLSLAVGAPAESSCTGSAEGGKCHQAAPDSQPATGSCLWIRHPRCGMELSQVSATLGGNSKQATEQLDPLLTRESAASKTPGVLQIIRVNFVRYCQTTSLRGVPKIVKTRQRCLKCIWATFVLTFFIGCFTCLGFIINQYLARDVIHQPKTKRNHAVEFPSFTVCNTRPLSQSGINYIQRNGLMLPKEYTQHVFKAISNTARNMAAAHRETVNKTVKDALSTIFDTKGYFENMPSDMNGNVGHKLERTILLCESTILVSSFKRSKFCDSIGTWQQTYDNKFLNCYTFTADSNHTKSILTVRIMAYTNERNLTHCPDCSNFPATQVSGLRVQLHNAGNYPEVQEEGLNIKPGSLTEIRFETKQWDMKEPPHGACSRLAPPLIEFRGTNFTYSYQACKKKVLHERIHSECGCLDSTIPLPDTLKYSNATYCGRIPQFSLFKNATSEFLDNATRSELASFYGLEPGRVILPSFKSDNDFMNFLRRVTCNMEIFIKADEMTVNQCFSPCVFYTYETTISTTNWPTRAYLYEIVDDFKALKRRIDEQYKLGQVSRNSSYLEPIYKDLLQIYGPVSNLAKTNVQEAERMLRNIDYVQSNFIEILINRGKSNFDIEVIEEKAVISLTSLLSQIGGLLSIWVGLTFVCIVEVIEMLYNIFIMCTSGKMPEL